MDGQVPPLLLLDLIQGLADGLYRLIGAGESEAQGGDHPDGVLVQVGQHGLWGDGQAARLHGHLPQLDVPVAGKLLPAHLHRAGDQVGPVGGFTHLLPCLLPPEVHGQAPQHAGLRGAHRRGAHRVAGLRGVPEVCQHVDTPGLDLRRLGILVLVDDVLVDAQVHELADLVVSVGLAKGGQVLPGIAV